jgi:acetylornithine/succinyldiaminopimelate/putrescine aminotransferase
MLENVRALEKHLRASLEGVSRVERVRGAGLLLGLEFADEIAAKVHLALLGERIITGTSSDARVLRLLPPLCLQREEVDLFVAALKRVLPAL